MIVHITGQGRGTLSRSPNQHFVDQEGILSLVRLPTSVPKSLSQGCDSFGCGGVAILMILGVAFGKDIDQLKTRLIPAHIIRNARQVDRKRADGEGDKFQGRKYDGVSKPRTAS